jgi:hypothetical protein
MTAPVAFCLEGHVKRDPATNRVALRTQFREDEIPDMAWLVVTTNFGSKYVPSVLVEGWDDLYVPTLPSADNVQPTSVEYVDNSASVFEPIVEDAPVDPPPVEETPI